MKNKLKERYCIGLLYSGFSIISAPVLSEYQYRVYYGDFNQLPVFESRSPNRQGRTNTLSLSISNREDYYAITFEKVIEVAQAGIYEFALTSDDGSRLIIDSTEIINNDGLHAPVTKEGQVYLDQGSHQLRVEFFEKFGGNTLELQYRSTGGNFQAVPINGQLIQTGPSVTGQWGRVIPWPEIAISAANLPDGRVLTWSSTETNSFPSNRQFSHASVFDPVTESFISVDNNFHDMFCAGISLLEDGRVFASGGNPSDRRSSSFDPSNFSWSPLAEMRDPRWYATNITLADNQVFTSFGKDAGNRSERYSPENNAWSPLSNVSMQTLVNEQNAIQAAPNPSGAFSQEWFAHLAVAPNGQVFQGGPTQTWHLFNPSTNLPNQSLGRPIGDNARMYGNAVTYDVGKVMLIGGGDRRQQNPTNENTVFLVDLNQATPQITRAAPMNYPRALSNSVTLPNGEILVIGGNRSAKIFSDEGSVLPTELYSPSENRWQVLSSLSIPRNYHSTALLLKDGRVLSAGGGACGNGCAANHQDGQLFSPPYLFDTDGNPAQRPIIRNLPSLAQAGQTLVVNASADTSGFALIRLSGTTHHINTDQRHIPIDFQPLAGGEFQLELPANPNVLIVGNYWLFALNEQGTPSIGQTLQVVRADASVPSIAENDNELKGEYSPFRYYRWTPTQLRASNADSVQLAELALYQQGQRLLNANVSNPNGNNPFNEEPDKVNDNQTRSKWLDFNKGALVYNFNQPVAIDSYTLTTANDFPERDPMGWTLEGSNDANNWVLLDTQTQNNEVLSTARFNTSAPIQVTSQTTDGVSNNSDSTPADSSTTEQSNADTSDQSAIDQTAPTDSIEPDNAITPLPSTPRRSSTLVFEAGVERLWNVNPDQNTVSLVENGQLSAEISVGQTPWSLALRPNSNQLFVVNKGDASVSIINRDRGIVQNIIQLPSDSQPHGLVFSRDGDHYFVVLEAEAVVEKRLANSHQLVTRLPLSGRPRHLSMAHDDSVLLVSNFITPPIPGENSSNIDISAGAAEVFSVNPQTLQLQQTIPIGYDNRSISESQGPGLPNYLGASAISFDNQRAYLPSKKDNVVAGGLRQITGLTFDQTVRAGTSIIDLASGQALSRQSIDHDNASMATSAALSGDNRYLLVTLETSRELVIYDLEQGFQVMRLSTGRAPQSVVLSADGRIAYVHNYMDRSVSRFDLTDLLSSGLSQNNIGSTTVRLVSREQLAPDILKGKQLFYDAADDRLARDNYLSCASCHNDGMDDGRVWDFTHLGEGLRNTASLKGKGDLMKGGLLHWSGNFDEVQDFEMNIRSLAGGSGLMNDSDFLVGTRTESLGTPKANVSGDLDALAAYLASLTARPDSPQIHQGNTLEQAQQGQRVFSEKGCSDCHGSDALATITPQDLTDIGTLTAASGQRLSRPLTGLKPPSLANIWLTPPYLHNGSASNIESAIQAHNNLSITAMEMEQLVAFLHCGESCPEEQPYTPTAGDVIHISRDQGNYCVDVSDVSRRAGANIHQWRCNDALLNQQWRVRQSNGGFQLVAEHSGQCMDMAWASRQAGASTLQWYCHGGDNQILNWRNGQLVFKHSNLCLAASGDPLNANGADFIQMPCSSSSSQQLTVKKLR